METNAERESYDTYFRVSNNVGFCNKLMGSSNTGLVLAFLVLSSRVSLGVFVDPAAARETAGHNRIDKC